ncbi:hypothetical protein ACFL6U_12245 [Planctomycetota bacterium]
MTEKQYEERCGWLPVIEIGGDEFVVDIDRRKLCQFNNPENTIDLHTVEAKQMLASIQGIGWPSHTPRDVWEKKREAVS